MKTLIFFTSQFPYGTGETFIENEISFLSAAFDKIIIICNELRGEQTRKVPDNVQVLPVTYEVPLQYKLKALSKYFSTAIQNERHFIKHSLKLKADCQVLSPMLGGFAKALETADIIEKLVAEHKTDTNSLYLYSYWMNNTAAGIAFYRTQHPEVKAFCRAHGWDVYFERHQPPYLPLKSFILENLNACFCVSKNGRDYLDKITELRFSDKLKISRLGTLNSLGKTTKASADGFSVVSCSSIIPLKRINLVVEALNLIQDIKIKWTHFGNGPLEADIKKLAVEKLKDSTNVQYRFAGQVSNEELMNFYQNNAVDIFINVSETEGLPVSMMEANSFGIPVIATNVGGVSEIITDGNNGFLIAANPPAIEIAGAMRRFFQLTMKEKIEMRSNAFEKWNGNFNAEKNYSHFIDSIKWL